MRAYKKFVENIAGLFELTSAEGDLASLEARIRQFLAAEDPVNKDKILEIAGEMSISSAASALERCTTMQKRLWDQETKHREATEGLRSRCSRFEKRNEDLEEQHVEYREKLAEYEKYKKEEHGYALELLEDMKEELLQQANKQVTFLTQLVDGVVDDNKELLTKLGAAGDKDALKRILDNQQSDLFEKVARAKALLGRPLEMEEEAPEEQRLLDINKDGPIITEDMYKFFTGGQ